MEKRCRRWSRRGFLAATLALAGCAGRKRPPLGPLYEPTRDSAGQPPLVLIPGAFGSSLRDRRTGREIWPRSNPRLLTSSYRDLEVSIDPATLEPIAGEVEAYDIFREGLGRDFYGRILDTLEAAAGYVRREVGQPPLDNGRGLYIYLYDWRLDNVAAARGLHEFIEGIRRDYGDPGLRVDMLAHSNGGLLARYYARYGPAELPDEGPLTPTNAGASSIRRLLLIGTPNLGTIQPIVSHLRGAELGLRHIPQDVIASSPAVAQMMPHPAIHWAMDLAGRDLALPHFDIDTWRTFEWSIFSTWVARRTVAYHGGGADGRRYLDMLREYLARHLRRGRRFMESLAVPGGTGQVRPYVFGGDCELTLAKVVIEPVGKQLMVQEHVADIVSAQPGIDYESLMFEPGDTVVTRSSLLGRRTRNIAAPRQEFESVQVANSIFLCEEHQKLTGNVTFQDNLLNTLLNVDMA